MIHTLQLTDTNHAPGDLAFLLTRFTFFSQVTSAIYTPAGATGWSKLETKAVKKRLAKQKKAHEGQIKKILAELATPEAVASGLDSHQLGRRLFRDRTTIYKQLVVLLAAKQVSRKGQYRFTKWFITAEGRKELA